MKVEVLPRRKKSDKEKVKEEPKEKVQKKKASKKKDVYTDPIQLLDEYLDEVITAIGISYLNFTREDFKEIIKDPFAAAVGQVKSKPKSRTIINRLNASRDSLMEVVSYNIIRMKDISNLTDDQLEFVVSNVKRGIISLAPRLYEECKRRRKEDLIDILRSNWNMYGILSPFTCPRCGFNAVMPDYSCKVCGSDVSMKEVKKQLNVMQLLKDYASFDVNMFKDIVKSGFFYYKDGVIYPPSSTFQPNDMVFEIVLSKDEKSSLLNTSDISHHG